jgi:hypothetical protein
MSDASDGRAVHMTFDGRPASEMADAVDAHIAELVWQARAEALEEAAREAMNLRDQWRGGYGLRAGVAYAETIAAAIRVLLAERDKLRALDAQSGKVEAWIAMHTDFIEPPHEGEKGAEGLIAALERMKAERDAAKRDLADAERELANHGITIDQAGEMWRMERAARIAAEVQRDAALRDLAAAREALRRLRSWPPSLSHSGTMEDFQVKQAAWLRERREAEAAADAALAAQPAAEGTSP